MKRTIIICAFLFFHLLTHAQTARLDSLHALLDRTSNYHDKADVLHTLTLEYWDYDFEKCKAYAEKGYELSVAGDYVLGSVRALTDIGMYYYYVGNYKRALYYFRKAVQLSDNEPVFPYPGYIYIRIGNVYRVQARFDSAKTYYNKAKDFFTNKGDDKESLSSLYHNIGLLRYELADYRAALNNFNKALSFRIKAGDSTALGEPYKSIGIAYLGLDNLDSASFFLEKVQYLADRFNNPELSIFYNLYQGELLYKRGELLKAIQHDAKALDLLTKHDFKRYQAITLKKIGQVLELQGDYQRAMEYVLNALKISQQLNSQQEIGRNYTLLGWLYADQKDYVHGQQYAKQSRDILWQIRDDFSRSETYTLMGYIAASQQKYDEALQYYDSSLAIRKWFDAKLPTAQTMHYIAQVYTQQGRFTEALMALEKEYSIHAEVGNRAGVATYYNDMSELRLKLKQFAAAEKYAQQAFHESQELKLLPQMRKALLTLATIYNQSRNYGKAIAFYDRYMKLSDSLYTAESSSRQAQLNALYQLEQHEQKISLLNQQNELQKTTLLAQENRLKFQNTVLVASIFGIIIISVLTIVLFRYYRNKNRAHQALSELNRSITEKNEEIQAQSEELIEANDVLTRLNQMLVEKQNEIKAQATELRVANQTIHEINKHLEQTIATRTAQLKEAYRELGIFFYRSSHDFRRPLTTFMGLAEVAKITVKDEIALQLFEKVNETARNLDKMLLKLQAISDMGTEQPVFKEVLLAEMLDALCDTFQAEILQKCAKVAREIALSRPFHSDPALIKMILENLLENAIHFGTPEGCEIMMKATEGEGYIQIKISDNGPGIPKEYQEQVFEMYFRGSERSRGNGLGLYIVKKAVEKLNGTVRMETEWGRGTTFIVTLPQG